MESERSRRAREALLKKYRFGVAKQQVIPPLIYSISITGPPDVVVGEFFTLHVHVTPANVNHSALVSLVSGTPYAILTRRLTFWNSPTGDPGSGDFQFVAGAILPYSVDIRDSEGEFTVTEYTMQPFSIQVTCGGESVVWPVSRENVWCKVSARHETPEDNPETACKPYGPWQDDQPWAALPSLCCDQRLVLRRSLTEGPTVSAIVKDLGPQRRTNPYWAASAGWPPESVVLHCKYQDFPPPEESHEHYDGAGIDLAQKVLTDLGVGSGIYVYWRFE
jgi:hypothetical protein